MHLFDFKSISKVEGAWNQDGKGFSIWDTFTDVFPINSPIDDGSDGKTAANSYNKLEADIEILNDLKVSFQKCLLFTMTVRATDLYDNL